MGTSAHSRDCRSAAGARGATFRAARAHTSVDPDVSDASTFLLSREEIRSRYRVELLGSVQELLLPDREGSEASASALLVAAAQ